MSIICSPLCASTLSQIQWAQECDNTHRPGGVSRLVFYKCDPDYAFPEAGSWANLDNWSDAICNGIIFFSGEVLGQKPKGTFTKRRLGSCSPEKTISGSKTVTFQDFNADPDFADYDFWNNVASLKRFLQAGWITCDDRLFMVTGDFDLEIDEVAEDNSDGASFFDGTLTFQSREIIKPVQVDGLNDFLASFDVATHCYGY